MLLNFLTFRISIPKFSNKRTSFEEHRDHLSYDRLSQREIYDAICVVVTKKFIVAEKNCWKLAILSAFEKWRLISLNSFKDRPIITYRPRLEIAHIPTKPFYENGARIIHRLLWCRWWFFYVRTRFVIWKFKVLEIGRVKRRFFNKWNVKSARLKLNRLTGMRFLYLARPLEAYFRLILQQKAIWKWKAMSDKIQMMRWLRVILKCWRTVIIANNIARRSLKNDALTSFKLLCERERMTQNMMVRIVRGRLATRAQERTLALWQKSRRVTRILRRLCYRGSMLILYQCLNIWKQSCRNEESENEHKDAVLANNRDTVPVLPATAAAAAVNTHQKVKRPVATISIQNNQAGRRKISYQSRDCNVVYKRFVKVPRQQGPIAAKVKVVYAPTTSYQSMTLEQRARIRLENLKKFENDFILEETERRGAKNMKETRLLL